MLLPDFGLDFGNLFIAMRNAGYSVSGFFAAFGSFFNEPFMASFVAYFNPSLYLLIKPIIDRLQNFLEPILGLELTHLLLGPSLLEMIGIGIVLCVFANIFKKIWQLIPFA